MENVPVTLLDRLCELEKQRDYLLSERNAEQLRVRLPKEDIRSFILNFNTEYDDALLRTFLTKLILYDDHAVIEYDAGDSALDVPLQKVRTRCGERPPSFTCSNHFYIENASLFIIVSF